MKTSRILRALLAAVIAAGAASCASPPPQSPDRSAVWGYLSLVPHSQAGSGGGGSGSYGDRRMRHVRLVDYSRPGFAVVYVDGEMPPEQQATRTDVAVSIRPGGAGVHIEPANAAVSAGSRVQVSNASLEDHILSCPAAGLVRHVAPGETVAIDVRSPGEYPLFLLDVPSAESRVFAAPGTFAVVSPSGRFELTDLQPGRHELHAWHARLPPTSRWIDLEPGGVQRVDVKVGVQVSREAADAD